MLICSNERGGREKQRINRSKLLSCQDASAPADAGKIKKMLDGFKIPAAGEEILSLEAATSLETHLGHHGTIFEKEFNLPNHKPIFFWPGVLILVPTTTIHWHGAARTLPWSFPASWSMTWRTPPAALRPLGGCWRRREDMGKWWKYIMGMAKGYLGVTKMCAIHESFGIWVICKWSTSVGSPRLRRKASRTASWMRCGGSRLGSWLLATTSSVRRWRKTWKVPIGPTDWGLMDQL